MKVKIFIVFHENLYFENYKGDKLFSDDYYTYIKVGNSINKYELPNIIDICQLKNFISIGKHYAESEAIYNIYLNPEIYEDLDYIGFSQYDKEHYSIKNKTSNITEEIINRLNEDIHISLESYQFKVDYNQHIMMDESRPNELTGNGKNCYHTILDDYNKFFDTKHTMKELEAHKINLVSSFIIPIKNFKNIMKFISFIIESGKLDKFDTNRVHRLQGGLIERYIGVAIIFEGLNHFDLTINHLNQK